MSHHWDVKIGSVHHVVELADAGSDPPWIVACDGVEYMFPKFDLHRQPVVVRFDLDGRPASVTMRTVGATVPQAYVGVGVVPMTTFMTYELMVDDSKRGTWVASEVAGEIGTWAFVKPGGDVPKRPVGLWYPGTVQDPSWGVYPYPEHELMSLGQRFARARAARSGRQPSAYRRNMLMALGLSLGLSLATILLAIAVGYGD